MSKMLLISFSLAAFVLASCGVERYPLVIHNGQTYLETRDRNGVLVLFLIDTGAPVSFLSRSWVASVGGREVLGPPNSSYGINLSDQWKYWSKDVPIPPGVPSVLQSLPLVPYSRSGFLGLSPGNPGPNVGTLGADVLWDFAVDFRGNTPVLVRGAEAEKTEEGRVRYDVFQEGPHYVVPAGLYTTDAEGIQSGRAFSAILDTGCAYPFLAFYQSPPSWPATVPGLRSGLRANGLPVAFFSTKGFQIGAVPPEVFVAAVLDGPASGDMFLLGTPFFQAHRAVVDLKRWSFSFEPRGRILPDQLGSPETWGWKGQFVEEKGIQLQTVFEGSLLEKRGIAAGDWVVEVDGEKVAQARSVLEWNRLWGGVALRASALTP